MSAVSEAANTSRAPFDTVTIAVHWITVLIVLFLLVTGLMYGTVRERSWAPLLLGVHRSLGVTIWTVSVARLAWRFTGARFPEFPASMTFLHRLAARLSEYALYILLLVQPLTGFAQSVWRGRPFQLFGWTVPPLVPKNLDLAVIFHEIHEVGAWCLIALVSLHAAAALMHHYILRDDVLHAMVPVLHTRNEDRAAAG